MNARIKKKVAKKGNPKRYTSANQEAKNNVAREKAQMEPRDLNKMSFKAVERVIRKNKERFHAVANPWPKLIDIYEGRSE